MGGSDFVSIGGFRIEAELKTSGTQGRVFRAVCETDGLSWCERGRIVALKTMQVSEDAERSWEKLRLQTETLVRLNHPNVVRYLGCFVEQSAFSEMHVVVQEFLFGESLKEHLQSHVTGLDADEAVKVMNGMIEGLAAAESCGLVHRDIKPDNVFLCQDGSVKLIDFEVARQSESTTSASGNMVGSFDYMAPDFTDPHFSGDVKSDIFSAGVVMHEILTGKLPYRRFSGQTQQASFAFLDRWSKDASGRFLKGSCAVSSSVERILAHARSILVKAMSPTREDRYQTFADVKADLAKVRFRDLKSGSLDYRILQLVGKGGFGEVFKAKNGGRTFAIKHLLKPEYASRFYREAKIMSELNDPSFVRFFDFFVVQHSGVQEAFLVMEFLPGMPGKSLRDAIRKSAGCGLDFESVMKAFIRYAHGLAMIHERGIYHRDIKPTNLYYPEDRPDAASIMDLGIARDESGTETTGQVPGTLDYMPPETALGGNRGDAGMDVYALGLCLYEALSGKKGFPRLPTGSQGFAQFFQRARDKVLPTFDADCVTSRPALLALLRRMTEPELSQRLCDAKALERELRTVLENRGAAGDRGGESDEDETAPGVSAGSAVASATSAEADDDTESVTGETAFLPAAAAPRKAVRAIDEGLRQYSSKKPMGRGVKILLAFLVLLALSGVTAFFVFRTEVDCLLTQLLENVRSGSGELRREDGVLAEIELPDLYGDDSVTVEDADKVRDRWLADRKTVMSESEYVRAVSFFEQKREQRIIRDRLDSESARYETEIKAVEKAYHDEGVKEGDDRREAWLKAWSGASRSRIAAAVTRFNRARGVRLDRDAKHALLPRAAKAVDKVVKSYAEIGAKLADREADAWRQTWTGRLLDEDFAELEKRIAKARDTLMNRLAVEKRERERMTLFDECKTLVGMLTPVETRGKRLVEAELKLGQAVGSGLIDRAECDRFLAQIKDARGWTVFEVVNRSDLDVEVDGHKLKNTATRLFVYTNQPPASLAVTCFGYESIKLGREDDGRRLELHPEHFALLKVDVTVPDLGSNVLCRVDGVAVREKTVKILPGSHECTYSQGADWKLQVLPFRVEPGVATSLPPLGKWVRSEEWLRKEQDRVRAEKAKVLERRCLELLADEPVSNRVSRLNACSAMLRDWTAPDTLGESRHRDLSSRLKKAEALAIGAVVNATGREMVAVVSGEELKVNPGERMLVEYLAQSKLVAEFRLAGYDTIRLPEKLNEKEFTVTVAMLRPSPVAFSVNGLPPDAVCIVDDGLKMPEKVLPGTHTARIERPDYESHHLKFIAAIGEPARIDCPYRWKESKGLYNLISAETAADTGDWNRVKNLLGEADVRGEDALKRKMALNLRYEQRKRFLERLDEAVSAYHEERWQDVVKIHFELQLNGYKMTREDRDRVAASVKNRRGHLEMLKKISETGDFGTSKEKVEAEVRSFEAMAGLLEKEIQSAGKGEKK